jgi:phospholipase/lecithinase/hemolysin
VPVSTTKVPATTTTAGSVSTSKTPSASSSSAPPVQTGTKYFISFGDSYSQTGFNITGQKPSAANPLGNPPLPGWTASGGLDWPGFMVTAFNTSLTLSYNFAYGGATVDGELVAPYEPTVLSFTDQVGLFSEHLAEKPAYAPWTADNTVAGVWMGVNDVGNTFWLSGQEARYETIMEAYFRQVQIVYDAGVRKFVLLTVPPTNRSPLMLANPPESQQQLVSSIALWNELLEARLAAFTAANAGVKTTLVDTTAAFDEALDNPTKYGAPDATCESANGVSCLWFNNYHPGVAIQRLVGSQVAKALEGFFQCRNSVFC